LDLNAHSEFVDQGRTRFSRQCLKAGPPKKKYCVAPPRVAACDHDEGSADVETWIFGDPCSTGAVQSASNNAGEGNGKGKYCPPRADQRPHYPGRRPHGEGKISFGSPFRSGLKARGDKPDRRFFGAHSTSVFYRVAAGAPCAPWAGRVLWLARLPGALSRRWGRAQCVLPDNSRRRSEAVCRRSPSYLSVPHGATSRPGPRCAKRKNPMTLASFFAAHLDDGVNDEPAKFRAFFLAAPA